MRNCGFSSGFFEEVVEEAFLSRSLTLMLVSVQSKSVVVFGSHQEGDDFSEGIE